MKRLFILLSLSLLMTSCLVLPPSGEATLTLTYSPNPTYECYYDSYDGWVWTADITIKETSGVSVTLGDYSSTGYCCITKMYAGGVLTDTYYYTASDVEGWFGTLEIPAYGSIYENEANFFNGNNATGSITETYYGQDENGNTVSCTNTIYLENSNKGNK